MCRILTLWTREAEWPPARDMTTRQSLLFRPTFRLLQREDNSDDACLKGPAFVRTWFLLRAGGVQQHQRLQLQLDVRAPRAADGYHLSGKRRDVAGHSRACGLLDVFCVYR